MLIINAYRFRWVTQYRVVKELQGGLHNTLFFFTLFFSCSFPFERPEITYFRSNTHPVLWHYTVTPGMNWHSFTRQLEYLFNREVYLVKKGRGILPPKGYDRLVTVEIFADTFEWEGPPSCFLSSSSSMVRWQVFLKALSSPYCLKSGMCMYLSLRWRTFILFLRQITLPNRTTMILTPHCNIVLQIHTSATERWFGRRDSWLSSSPPKHPVYLRDRRHSKPENPTAACRPLWPFDETRS